MHRLPVTPFTAQNALIERLPGWASGFAYSMFLMTGGRIGDGMFHDILGHVTERRLRRVDEAPMPPGEFLAYHFRESADDSAWLTYLQREALAFGSGPVPHEDERLPGHPGAGRRGAPAPGDGHRHGRARPPVGGALPPPA